MLAGTGLGNQPFLAHLFCEQRLTKSIVQFMRTAMNEVLAFEVYPAPEFP